MDTRFEQPAELNRFIYEKTKRGWNDVWKLLWHTFPLWLFIWIMLIESVFVRVFFDSESLTLDKIVTAVSGGIFLPLLIGGVYLLQDRIERRSRRILKLGPRRINISPAGRSPIAWSRVVAFHFEPLANHSNARKLTLEYRLASRKSRLRRWSIILRNQRMAEAVEKILKSRQIEHATSFRIEQFDEILPKLQRSAVESKHAMSELWIYWSGYYLFGHGFPLLVVSIINSSPIGLFRQDASRSPVFSWIHTHFRSPNELWIWMLTSGTLLTAVGLALIIISVRRNSKRIEIEYTA